MTKVIFDWDKSYKKGIIVSDFLDIIREKFSIENPDARIIKHKYGDNAKVSERKYAITTSGRFQIGLFYDIYRFLRDNEIDFDIFLTDPFKENLFAEINSNSSIVQLYKPLRYYQENAIKKSLKFGRGVIIVGTGGGKTLLMASLIETINKECDYRLKSIIILPAQLIEQTYNDLLEYGIPEKDITQWGGKHKFDNQRIIIASSKTLETSLIVFKKNKLVIPKNITPEQEKQFKDEHREKERKRKKLWNLQRREYLKQLQDINLVLIDEVHSLRKDNTFNKTIDLFDTKHKFGFTGTMPTSQLDCWNIIGKTGPILEEIPSCDLREQGFLSQAFATVLKITYQNPVEITDEEFTMLSNGEIPSTTFWEQECDFLYENEYRNKVLCHIVKKAENNTLILVNRIIHGETLYEIFSNNIPEKKVYYIRGDVPMKDRECIRKLMEVENNIVCIAMSKCFSVGINITNLHYIIFALAGKAKIRFIQSIGRGLRLHENKFALKIIDLFDNLHYGIKHFEERRKLYEEEKIEYETRMLSE